MVWQDFANRKHYIDAYLVNPLSCVRYVRPFGSVEVWVELESTANYETIKWDGVNEIVVDGQYIVQSSGYTRERGLFIDDYCMYHRINKEWEKRQGK